MRKNNKNILYTVIVVLLISVVTLSIAYAALSTILKVEGNAQVNGASWNIHFENVKEKTGSINATKKATIVNNNQIDFNITLNKPGDYYEFDVDIVNSGTIDGMIESIVKNPSLTPTQEKYLMYEIKYTDGNKISNKELIQANKKKTINIKLMYKTNLTSNDLPTTPDNLNLSFTILYSQADDSGTLPPGGGGTDYKKVRVLSGTGTNLGDEIAIKNEHFYVFKSDETTVTMLSQYNLYVGGWNEGAPNWRWYEYGNEQTGIQHPDMRAWIESGPPYKGVYRYSAYGNKYANSFAEQCTLNYKSILESYGVPIKEARIITKQELIDLGCVPNGVCNEKTPKWVYTTSYWTNTPEGKIDIWRLSSLGEFGTNNYYNEGHGIRPVITINKDLLNK